MHGQRTYRVGPRVVFIFSVSGFFKFTFFRLHPFLEDRIYLLQGVVSCRIKDIFVYHCEMLLWESIYLKPFVQCAVLLFYIYDLETVYQIDVWYNGWPASQLDYARTYSIFFSHIFSLPTRVTELALSFALTYMYLLPIATLPSPFSGVPSVAKHPGQNRPKYFTEVWPCPSFILSTGPIYLSLRLL